MRRVIPIICFAISFASAYVLGVYSTLNYLKSKQSPPRDYKWTVLYANGGTHGIVGSGFSRTFDPNTLYEGPKDATNKLSDLRCILIEPMP